MQTNIKFRITFNKRFLSFLLAFIVAFVGLPFVGFDMGVKADTLSGDGKRIYSTKADTSTKVSNTITTGDTDFSYTGTYQTAPVTLFDYVSDEEIIGNYNSVLRSVVEDFVDPFTALNSTISQSNKNSILYESDKNITITLSTTSFDREVYVHLWNEDNGNVTSTNGVKNETAWPGKRMTYDPVNSCFTYTFNRTDSSSIYYLNFNPNKLIFNDGLGNQSPTLTQVMSQGKIYEFKESGSDAIIYRYNNSANPMYVCYWDDDHPHTFHSASDNDKELLSSSHKQHQMTYNSSKTRSEYTWNPSDTDYTPRKFTINNGYKWEFINNGATDFTGLPWNDQVTIKGFIYTAEWMNDNLSVTATCNKSYTCTSNGIDPAQPIYQTKYSLPLYFGGFLRKGNNGNADDTGNYTSSTVPPYNNFYWLNNLAPRNHTHVSVQGLVNNTLSGGAGDGDLLDKNGEVLPYFDIDWAGQHSDLVKYYNKDDKGEQLTFPFYQERAAATSNNVKKNSTNPSPTTDEYAQFYQFNSEKLNVRFDIAKTNNTIDPTLHQGNFVETSVPIISSLNNQGYFPFDYEEHRTKNNIGFGSKFVMQFTIEEDGCVAPVDSSGKPIPYNANGTNTRIQTLFEFEGDDDLWVFIDGNLMLDMGGDHGQSKGSINFADKIATAYSAIAYSAANQHNLAVSGSLLSVKNDANAATDDKKFEFTRKLKDGSFDESTGLYDPKTLHTMTIFYMERGMNDSNLKIRYNYSTIDNSSKMKIQEITKFTDVNPGLMSYTVWAADQDVFEYTVSNKGTEDEDVKDNEAAYPTSVQHIRNNHYDENDNTKIRSTQLTPNGTGSPAAAAKFDPPADINLWEPVGSTTYEWEDWFANMYSTSKPGGTGKGAGKTTSDGKMYLMYGTYDNGESSGEFQKQFAKNSFMRVVQGDYLFKPGVVKDANDAPLYYTINNASGRKTADYYSVSRVYTKEIGQKVETDLTADYNADPTQYDFRFKNEDTESPLAPVQMTEYFENEVKAGSLTITKRIKDGNTSGTENDATDTGEFTFTITFSDVFGESGNNPVAADYANIVSKKSVDLSPKTGNIDSSRQFTLKANQSITIGGIPNGTHYTITESATLPAGFSGDPTITYNTTIVDNATFTVGDTTTTPALIWDRSDDNDDTVTVINIRQTRSLTLKKNLGTNAPSSASGDNFTFIVVLTPPTGVNLNNYVTATYNHSQGGYEVSVPGDGTAATISGIPVGTEYSVFEVTTGLPLDGQPIVTGGTNGNGTGTIGSGSSEVTITNNFLAEPTIHLTKKDSGTNTIITTGEATFTLMKLKSEFDWTSSAILTDFQNALSSNYSSYIDGEVTSLTTTSGVLSVNGSTSVDPNFLEAGRKYFFYETDAPSGYKKNNTVTADRIITLHYGPNEATINNTPNPTEVTVEKHDSVTDDGLEGGEFDLYIKEKTTPPTYSMNQKTNAPNKNSSVTINSVTPPTLTDETGTAVQKPTYSYSYQDESAPKTEEKTWIQPRTDNDYIYFRDYNSGTKVSGNYYGTEDTPAFTASSPNYAWLYTYFSRNNFNQDEEIFYDHEHHNYWFAAQFATNASGANKVQYAMWERFVDHYDNVDTVVWKIQPPDGYTHVRFCLYDGDTCIRRTVWQPYELGEIYHKTNWGARWENRNNTICYFDVPLTKEAEWTTYSGTPADKRMTYTSTAPKQADRYEPTEDKIVFHCNSDKVWHNIHIEFFDQSGNTIGQTAPGYMMEPYARAGNDYRINGYLTYELTIPKGAKKFRVNNGVSSGIYNYHSGMIDLKTDGGKNNGNYFKLSISTVTANTDLAMSTWSDNRDTNETYSANNEIESDYDYIYFEKPESGWNNHIYAYFYGGGNLRADNWQRACYSIWPGVAPVGTEYKLNGTTDYHSDVYTYTYTNNLYDPAANTAANLTNAPDAVFTDTGGKTVYKFRIPLGDRTNYGKVIFNDGLNKATGGNETKVISYKPGYLYKEDGSSEKHTETSSTNVYTARSHTSDEYIYIKMASSGTVWDDLHIQFYDVSGKQILQDGNGYVMKYAGTQGGYEYYRVPIPAAAEKFSLTNGKNYKNNTGAAKYSTEQYDILKYNASPDVSGGSLNETKDRLVYELTTNGTKGALERTSPKLGVTQNPSGSITVSQNDKVDYKKRGDKIYIKDAAGWNPSIGAAHIKFYDTNNQQISTSSGMTASGSGIYDLIKAKEGEDIWYYIDIPEGAVKFTYTDGTHTVSNVAIYPLNSDTTGTTSGWTNGNMYYETQNTNQLPVTAPTFTDTNTYANDETYAKRGDYLYLLCADDTARTVKFYDDQGSELYEVQAKYLNVKGGKYWYKVSIPTDAQTFSVTTSSTNTSSAKIYELCDKASRYKIDYTVADMQYELSADNTTLTCTYPVFTENPVFTLADHDDITTEGGSFGIDESAVSGYKYADVVSVPQPSASVPNPLPVLYPTDTNNISYSWIEGSADNKIRFDITDTGWTNVKVKFTVNGLESTFSMDTDSQNSNYRMLLVPENATSVEFINNDTSQTTGSLELNAGNNFGKNMICRKGTDSITAGNGYIGYDNRQTLWEHVYAYIWQDGNDSNKNNAWPGVEMSDDDHDGIWTIQRGSGQNKVIFNNGDSSNVSNIQTETLSVKDGNIFVPGTGKLYVRVNSNVATNASEGQFRLQYKGIASGTGSDPATAANGDAPEFSGSGLYRSFDPANNNKISGSTYNEVKIFQWSTSPTWSTDYIDISASGANGAGLIIYVYKQGDQIKTSIGRGAGNGSWKSSISIDSWGLETYAGANTNYSASYQPEDRYALISNINAIVDANDFITINTNMTNPYIMFYSDAGGTTQAISAASSDPLAATGMKLQVIDKDGNDSNNLYKIRLPKNAVSFIVSSGPSSIGTNLIQLYDGDLHHAGATFNINHSTGLLTSCTDRTGYTANKTTMSYPINPKSDADYIYFTDPSTFAGSNTVNAYYYGNVDGEYTAWPGVPAQRTYEDNNGKTVYVFQIPKSSDGIYSYVIFNNGSANDRKTTTAVAYIAGGIYTPGSTTQQYGSSTQTINAFNVNLETKSTLSTQDYGSSSTYIFFRNNGTSNFSTNYKNQSRYILDDVHIEFFSDEGTTPVGNVSPGYIPDDLGSNIYRIKVPESATHFRINNGSNKGTASETYNNDRKSEVKEIIPNALYKFVEGTECTKDGSNPNSISVLSTPEYLLEIDNATPAVTEDDEIPSGAADYIKLATIVTGSDGKQKYIKWLKTKVGDPTQVDTDYLDHTIADIYPTNKNVSTVKVVKHGEYYWEETVAPTGYSLPSTVKQTINVPGSSTPVFKDDPAPVNGGALILTKTAKEKVGNNDIGDTLAGAQFKLIKVASPNNDESLRFTQTAVGDYSYAASGGTYNAENYWLTTDNNGKLAIRKLPVGDYYLEEQEAPTGFSNLDTNDILNGVVQKKKVYFSIGVNNTTEKNITCSDEMASAYIRLFEHIEELRPDEWGYPTFIFKIKNTTTNRTQLVSLTVDENEVSVHSSDTTKSTNEYIDFTGTGSSVASHKFTTDPLGNEYNDWYVESTTEFDNIGQFKIDRLGRIRVEPGTYEITRIPVSRYELIATSYRINSTDNVPVNDISDSDYVPYTSVSSTPSETVTLTDLEAGHVADVHYYDKVSYYDKFSQVDTRVNKFYTLDSTTKKNKTIKGIRIADYHQVGTTGNEFDTVEVNDTSTNLVPLIEKLMTVPVSRLTIYKIMSDGSEVAMTDSEKAALTGTNFIVSYTYDLESGDKESFGHATSPATNDFSYDNTDEDSNDLGKNPSIVVHNSQKYENGVYTLKAKYKTDAYTEFTTTFDLVFLRSST